MAYFLLQVVQVTLTQIISILGIFFVFGFLLSFIQAAILRNYRRSVGWRGVLWTAWLGTPVHEYSHAIMALLFHHRIDEVALFSPDPNTGELGHVNHSYDRRSFYQSSGNFFIGLAPLIIGPGILVGLLYMLVPRGGEIFNSLAAGRNSLSLLVYGVKESLSLLFSLINFSRWQFWLFLYLSLAIASHLAPSAADLRGAWRGGLVIILYLFLLNIFALLAHWDLTAYILNFSHFFAGLISIYIYVLMISILHLILSYILLTPWRGR